MPKYAKTKDSSSTSSSLPSSKRIRYVPFCRGFKPRDGHARLLALGFNKETNVPREFTCGSSSALKPASVSSKSKAATPRAPLSSLSKQKTSLEFFKPVPQPTSQDDWLAQYDEDGQTYKQFMEESPWLSNRKVKYIKQTFSSKGKTLSDKYPDGKICILQLGKFENQSIEFSDIIDYTSRFLCLPVEQLPTLELEVTEGKVVMVDDPVKRGGVESNSTGNNNNNARGKRSTRPKRSELHSRYNSKTGHVQLRVDSVLSKLRSLIPQQALCLIALTTLDLYADASDLFVAGMAAGLQRVAVFSLQRYDPSVTFSKEHWYDLQTIPRPLPPAAKSRLMIHRSCKLLVHEILHLLGVDHCVFFDCCMNGSGHLAEDFRQPMHLCPVDLRKLHTLVGFGVGERYRSLREFYLKHGLEEEAEWVSQRLDYLGRS